LARRLGLALAVLVALGLAPAARADGDPASDVLYSANVFYSFDQRPSDATQTRLNTVVENARKAGYPVKVTLIASAADLGAVPVLFEQPRRYARFLGLELAFVSKSPLVVVMPNGLGYFRVHENPAKAYAALRPVRVGSGGDAQANAAVEAIGTLAAQAGHPLAIPPPAASSNSSSGPPRLILLTAGIAALLVAVAAPIVIRRRARR